MKVKIKKTNPKATIPTRGSASAAGYDLYACIEESPTIVFPGETAKISTGISVEIPEGYFGAIYARSGLATKEGLRPANCVGVVDSDYRGEVIVALHNDNQDERRIGIIREGDRIAQLVIQPYLNVEFDEVDDLSETARGEGGFGSTGVN